MSNKPLWSPDKNGEFHLGDLMFNLEELKENRKEVVMSEIIIQVKLERQARKGGGDRYSGKWDNGVEWMVYLPQQVSREDGKVIQNFGIIIQRT